MNKSAFLELIQQAANISDLQTEELEKVAATFPYCQTAHLLLAKSAHEKGSMLSTQRLRRASAYATNRQVLKRVIYTSQAHAPVFEEPMVQEQEASLSEEVAATVPGAPAAVLQAEAANILASEVVKPDESNVNEVQDEVEGEATEESATQADPEVIVEAEAIQEDLPAASAATQSEADCQQVASQQTEEAMPFELAQLLTIYSLSPSFTDLLAQKADTQALVEKTPAHINQQDTREYPALLPEEQEALPQGYAAEENPAEDQSAYAVDAADSDSGATETAIIEAEQEILFLNGSEEGPAPLEAPQDAAVKYDFSEIERMYAEDALGYWMASSRMGEVLQLKDEVTRQQPVSFHPELILEYSKSHELQENPETQHSPDLHHQQDIIDQFLKLNPRLNTMNIVKMKQEPQEDLSLRNSKIKKGIASESLANIFLNQGKVKKAIKIYEQLILKNPEKRRYFAEQIEKLQNLK